MAKGYWVVRGDVYDKEQYSKYVESASRIINKFNGKFLVRGGEQTEFEIEGYERTVVIEFPSFDGARTFYNSAEYQDAHKILGKTVVRNHHIIEGA